MWVCLVFVCLLLRVVCVCVCTWFGCTGGLVHKWRTDRDEAKEAFEVCGCVCVFGWVCVSRMGVCVCARACAMYLP